MVDAKTLDNIPWLIEQYESYSLNGITFCESSYKLSVTWIGERYEIAEGISS